MVDLTAILDKKRVNKPAALESLESYGLPAANFAIMESKPLLKRQGLCVENRGLESRM